MSACHDTCEYLASTVGDSTCIGGCIGLCVECINVFYLAFSVFLGDGYIELDIERAICIDVGSPFADIPISTRKVEKLCNDRWIKVACGALGSFRDITGHTM